MNRRSFFSDWIARPDSPRLEKPSEEPRLLSTGLEPFIPDATSPWNALRVGHLLRRTTFMPRWQDIAAIAALTPSQAVDLLLDTPYHPNPPSVASDSAATESLEGLDVTLRAQILAQWQNDAATLRNWQADVMRDAGLTLAEKMTAFWSGHFTTEFYLAEQDYVQAPLLYYQNKLFRENGLGNFRDLVMSVTLDPAMLIYLGGDQNRVGAPNENFARELLELYTMGLGNYTEGDIKDLARILTGWHAARFSDQPTPNGQFKRFFTPSEHDINAKEFFGVTIASRDVTTNTEFLVQRDEIRKMVDTIFLKRGRAVAEFVCEKLYRFFIYSRPGSGDRAVISAMADIFVSSGFEIRPVMAALLKSAHFYDNANIGAQIKTPAEFEIGLARQLGLAASYQNEMKAMGQILFDPPNVSGWPGHHDWITTTTYPVRSDIALRAVTAATEASLLSFIKSVPDYQTVAMFLQNMATLLLPRPLSVERKATLQAKLLAGAPDYDWSDIVASSPATAVRNLRDALTTIVQLPDFQLC